MNWNSVSEFLAMGGYGLYVWGSFGVTALAIAGEVLTLRTRRKALRSMHRDDANGVASNADAVAHYVDYAGAPREA